MDTGTPRREQNLALIEVNNESGLATLRAKRTVKQLLLPFLRFKNRHSLRDSQTTDRIATAVSSDLDSFRPPLFILGHPRSGTTLLREILNRSDELVIPPENGAIRAMIDTFRSNRHLEWSCLVNRVLEQFIGGYESSQWRVDIEQVKHHALSLDKSQRSFAAVFHCLYGQYGKRRKTGEFRWGDKSTPGSFIYALDLIKVFPDAQFVHIVRDGRDCVSSCVRAGFYGGSAIRAAYAWKDNVRYCHEIGQMVEPDQFHVIKYEDLVEAPEQEMKKLCQFLKTDFDQNMLHTESAAKSVSPDIINLAHHKNVMNYISRRSIDNWRDQFSENSVDVITKTISTELQRYGYFVPK